jgi:hypothetical protein
MKKSAIVAAALLLGCNTTPPELLPPPFGPNGPQPTRLFFPTGMAKAAGGVLLVANGNFNRAFEAGTVVSVKREALDGLLSSTLDCDVANPDPACTAPIQPAQFFADAVMIGNYAGPLVLSTDKTAAYTGSRDSGKINAVRVGPGGSLGCPANAGDDARKDCRAGIIDLRSAGVDGPYAIAAGDSVLPGRAAQSVLFVSSITPHIESIGGAGIITSTAVAALSMQDPSKLLFTMQAGSFFIDGGYGVGPMVFDEMRRQLYLSGCYQRSTAFGAGEPGTGLCIGVVNNFLRILNVDAGSAAALYLLDLRADVLSTYTTQLLLDVPDPPATLSAPPATLWATMRNPDSLVVIELPAQPSVAPRVREIVSLPVSPSDMVRIDRGIAPPLLAIVAERLGAVSIFDTGSNQVVAQVGRLGDSPFNIQQIDCPASKPASACLAVSVFGNCRLALIEVPKDAPSKTALRALAGSCP